MGRVLKINRMGDKKLALIIIIYNKIYSKIFIQSKYLLIMIIYYILKIEIINQIFY